VCGHLKGTTTVYKRVVVKPGLWTMDWTVDWTVIWTGFWTEYDWQNALQMTAVLCAVD